MADRTDISSTAVSAGYLQMLFTADDAGIIVTGAGTPDTIVCTSSSGSNKKSCFRIGVDQCSIATGNHNFDIASHDGSNGLKLGGTLVTALGAELNYLDTTAGASAASKAMICDASGDIYMPDSDKFELGAGSDMTLYHDGSHSYITNATGTLKLATETSGIAVTIGHTTSETTVSDNLNTTGLIRVNDTTEATSATDGSLQTDGGLSVVKDCVFGDDVFLLSDSAVLNMGAGNDVSLTHDGTTGGTLRGAPISIYSIGDLTLDSSTDIVIDAAGGNIEFKDAGTLQLTLDMDTTSGVQILKLGVNSDDLVFQQYDSNEVCRMADDRRLYFYDKGGEYISSDGTDLTIAAGDKVNVIAEVILTDTNVAHGVTSVAATDAYGDFGPIHATYGGLYINGISDQEDAGARSLALRGICNDTHTDTVPTVELIGAKRSGTSVQALAAAETVLQVANHTTTLMTVLGSGSVGVGTVTPDTTLEVVGSFAANGPSSTFVTMSSGDTSPDVSGGNIFKSHTDGVTIDQFDGGICGQIITIISGGATVYDVTSSELNGGTTNITTAAGDVTMWVCESATDWHLLSWMDLSIDLSSGGF